MTVLVCGGRDYRNTERLNEVLTRLLAKHPDLTIVHGGAPGADLLAGDWAQAHDVPVTVFRAAWDRYGRRAGPIRNQRMLDEGKPHLVVAFPGGAGTADMVAKAERAGVAVRRVDW